MSRARWLFAIVLAVGPFQDSRPGNASQPAPLPTQALVAPTEFAERAGGGNNNIPFSWKPVRWQQLFTPEAFGFDGTLLITGIAFRLDAGFAGNQCKEGDVDLQITLASGPPTVDEWSTAFDQNLGPDRQVVVPRTTLRVGRSAERDQDAGGGASGVWDLQIPFRRPFRYRTDRGLVLEVQAFGNSQGNQHFLLPLEAAPGHASLRRLVAPIESPPKGPPTLPERGTALDNNGCLVTRFDVAASAARAASRPASRPETRAR